jgi:hypothetical protein
MILKYLLIGVVRLIAYVIGLFLTPFNFWLRKPLRKYFPNVTWWFLNDTKPIDIHDIDSGDYGRFAHNIFGYWQQNAWRNSHWNLNLLIRPKNTNITDVKGNLTLLTINRYEKGFRYATYKAEEIKYFRLSWIIEIGKFYHHAQLGATGNRYLYKIKMGRHG